MIIIAIKQRTKKGYKTMNNKSQGELKSIAEQTGVHSFDGIIT